MTLPASGTISMSQFSVEMGQASTYSANMAWINANAKVASNSMSGHYGKAWYLKNNAGNCNNANNGVAYNCNCGSINCVNCLNCIAINCVNCDARAWLQANCNCACTYNCNLYLVSTNCDCQCGCCFVAGSIVIMADGSLKRIEDVKVGEFLMGAYGEANPILALNRPLLGKRFMARINGHHLTTLDHAHLLPDRSFGAVSLDEYINGENGVIQEVILADGSHEWWILPGFRDEDIGNIRQMSVGDEVWTATGPRKLESIVNEILPPDTVLYNFVVGGSHTYFVDDFCVTGFHNAHDFDHKNWVNTETPWGRDQYFRSFTNPHICKAA